MQSRAEKRKEIRKGFEERVPGLASPDFVARHVRPLLGDRVLEAGCQVEVVRSRGTPRMTMRYAFDDGVTVYGKVYTDGLGQTYHRLLRRLWEDGFGAGSARRVPEPLGYCAEEDLLLMRAARGRPLAARLLQEPIEQVLPDVRAAAHWLARLHLSSLAGLTCDPACNRIKVFELADGLAKAAAGHPADLAALLDHLQRLRALAPAEPLALVPTHGRFTPANVFVDGSDITVIDVDRLSLSDPAKDVAMFVFRCGALRSKAAGGAEDTEQLVREFVDTYREHSGRPVENLPYYTALFALKAFANCAKDYASGEIVRRQAEALHLHRFERCFAESVTEKQDHAPSEPALQTGAAPLRSGHQPSTIDSLAPINTQYLTAHLSQPPDGNPHGLECQPTWVRDIGTGRVTSRYELDAATVVFAKRYVDGLGAHSYQVQKAYWESGFGNGSRFRVPEPMTFLTEQNLFVMRESRGTPLVALLGNDSGEWKAGVGEAARWLAVFHRSPLRVGDPEPEWDSLKTFRLTTRLVKAAAAQPSKCTLLLDVMQMLKERLTDLPEGRPVVQTHGRFHHDHVFLSPEAITVIDLDRSRPTDPAKDVAEFVRVLRLAAFRAGVEAALTDKVTDAFLGEYLALVPDAAAGLPHYWLSFLVLSYLGHLRKAVPDGASAALTSFHQREIRRVSEMRL
jgi:aminoglycoside phosphotransferase (APT) family kinase protein